ncbi:MAG: RND transporter [Proteobacteria bacterium]|nr:RND transporter [Pseudomonadota bacterium]
MENTPRKLLRSTPLIDRLPLSLLLVAALTLGLAPFLPEPHLLEKLRLLVGGTLVRPLDWFDLLLHSAPWVLLLAKLARIWHRARSGRERG